MISLQCLLIVMLCATAPEKKNIKCVKVSSGYCDFLSVSLKLWEFIVRGVLFALVDVLSFKWELIALQSLFKARILA